jgi:ribonucleoside-diphosphate reductase alpha chain
MACFVADSTADTWKSMVDTIEEFGDIARQGGGAGLSLSKIRPEGDPVFGSTHARACGPIELMRMVSEVMSSITQAGFRGMAMLSTIRYDHPDIFNFIKCKQLERALRTLLKEDIAGHYQDFLDNMSPQLRVILDKFLYNFNLSVMVTDEFMEKVKADGDVELQFNGRVYRTVKAREIFDAISENAWRNGDPGLLFYDNINNYSPYRFSGQEIVATNPCGEQPIPNLASCNLGSFALIRYFDEVKHRIDFTKLKRDVRLATRLLDNVIDVNKFPTDVFEKWALSYRPIGIGIMGYADLLMKMRITYGSKTSLDLAREIMKTIVSEAHKASVDLAKERGAPSGCQHDELKHRRNTALSTIAPTGSISMIADCSSSAEPIYSPITYRHDNTGRSQVEHPLADKRYFRCSLDPENKGRDVKWQEHVETQAAFQEHVDSGISKTINFPNEATVDEIKKAYFRAWELKCKGITVYRDGSRSVQVLQAQQPRTSLAMMDRPDTLDCDIFKRTANGIEWHFIVGKYKEQPYELFALNGGTELPKKGKVIRRKAKHYALVDENGDEVVDNIVEAESTIDELVASETRRFSLMLRHGIPPLAIVEQVEKFNEQMASFSKVAGRLFKQHYVTDEEVAVMAAQKVCPICSSHGHDVHLVVGPGRCMVCPDCGWGKCG